MIHPTEQQQQTLRPQPNKEEAVIDEEHPDGVILECHHRLPAKEEANHNLLEKTESTTETLVEPSSPAERHLHRGEHENFSSRTDDCQVGEEGEDQPAKSFANTQSLPTSVCCCSSPISWPHQRKLVAGIGCCSSVLVLTIRLLLDYSTAPSAYFIHSVVILVDMVLIHIFTYSPWLSVTGELTTILAFLCFHFTGEKVFELLETTIIAALCSFHMILSRNKHIQHESELENSLEFYHALSVRTNLGSLDGGTMSHHHQQHHHHHAASSLRMAKLQKKQNVHPITSDSRHKQLHQLAILCLDSGTATRKSLLPSGSVDDKKFDEESTRDSASSLQEPHPSAITMEKDESDNAINDQEWVDLENPGASAPPTKNHHKNQWRPIYHDLPASLHLSHVHHHPGFRQGNALVSTPMNDDQERSVTKGGISQENAPSLTNANDKHWGHHFFEHFLDGSAGVMYTSFLGLIIDDLIHYGSSKY